VTLKIKPYDERLYRVFRDRRSPRSTDFPGEDTAECETDINHAINNFEFCWNNSNSEKSRFSDGSWPVLYTAEDCETAVTEVTYHLDRTIGTAFDDGELMTFNLVQYSMRLQATVACFENADICIQKQLTSDNYDYTNEVATRVREKAEALRSLSARRQNSFCVPVFSNRSINLRDVANKVVIEMRRGTRDFSSNRDGVIINLEIQNVSSDI
jgi:hypothetical protein